MFKGVSDLAAAWALFFFFLEQSSGGALTWRAPGLAMV